MNPTLRAVYDQTAHRPWAMPQEQARVMMMQWFDLLFIHWPVPASALQPHIPAPLKLETFDGSAWIGVVPFRMEGVRPRWLPSVPSLSNFTELNVRTYVTIGGKPGVWFFSLDAANPVAVKLARASFHLMYYDAEMRCVPDHPDTPYGAYDYASTRTHRGAPAAEFKARYRPTGPIYHSVPGTLEHWLTERYALYTADRKGGIWRGEIQHLQWPLQPAEAEITVNTMTAALGVELPNTRPLLHFAKRLDVLAWLPSKVKPSET